jgi:hypothetical protein
MYKELMLQLELREAGLLKRLAALPLQTSRPKTTPRAVARMSARLAVYSPAEALAFDARASVYDEAWGFCGDSTIAGFVDLERVRNKLGSLPPPAPTQERDAPWKP